MLIMDTQGNLFNIEKSEVFVSRGYTNYFLIALDDDLEDLDTHITVFYDESVKDVLEAYGFKIVKNS